MRVLAIINQNDAGPGVFTEVVGDAGHEIVEWRPFDEPRPERDGFGATMVFGGAMNVDEHDIYPWLEDERGFLRELVAAGAPLLGVCLGAQLLAEAAGGTAQRAARPEIGWHEVELAPEAERDPVIGALPDRFEAFQWHSYEATPPLAAAALATSPICIAAFRTADLAWGIQFHAEVSAAIAGEWIDKYDNDEDAVRLGIDPGPLLEETQRKIEAWNELGRGICARFLAEAEAATRA